MWNTYMCYAQQSETEPYNFPNKVKMYVQRVW